jgi:hypothetical protein
MIRRIEVGELLHAARLEKIVFCLQKRMKEMTHDTQRVPCEMRFSVRINHYTKMNCATVLNREEYVNEEFPIIGFSYTIEICETDHIIALYETGLDGKDPSVIVNGLLRKLDRYDIKRLYYCIFCMDELVEKDKECCDACELSKITYDEMCATCQDEDHLLVSSVWGRLECGHVFHKHCALQIKCHIDKRIKCPLCRHDQERIVVAVI